MSPRYAPAKLALVVPQVAVSVYEFGVREYDAAVTSAYVGDERASLRSANRQ